MRKIRICIYGGTDLEGAPTSPTGFIATLAEEILASMNAVLVTGGFLRAKKKPHAISTDVAVLHGARRYAEKEGMDLRSCYEAWIPEPSLDHRPDIQGAERMTEELGVTVRPMRGRTALGRRLAMVAGVDLVVTISGKVHTETVIEQALEVGIPVLPIPSAGGDSKKMLEAYRQRIAERFAPGALERCLASVGDTLKKDPRSAARAVVELLQTARIGTCLVLLPYDDEHDAIYHSLLEPAISEHMVPLRLDRLPQSAAIDFSFTDAIEKSVAVVADVTTRNQTVLYEIGYAHGRGLDPLLYTRNPSQLESLPVYLKARNVLLVPEIQGLRPMLDEYLRRVKARHSPL